MRAEFHGHAERGGIYIIDTVDGPYIGQAKRFASRHRQHEKRLRAGKHHNKAISRTDPTALVMRVVAIIDDQDMRDSVETATIVALGMGVGCVNQALLVPTTRGRKYSAESRAKMSAWQIGRKLTAEHCANMSIGKKAAAHKASPEARAKMSAARRGVAKTAEHRAKIGASQKGRIQDPIAIAKAAAKKRGRPWTVKQRAAYDAKAAERLATLPPPPKCSCGADKRHKSKTCNACRLLAFAKRTSLRNRGLL